MPLGAIAKGIAKAAVKRGATEAAVKVAPTLGLEAVLPEARRISQLNLGDFDLEAVHQTNFDRITTTDEVKSVIADTAERNKAKIQEARRGTITNEQLAGLASDLNVGEDVIRPVLERETGGTLNAETILAARQVLNASADRIVNLAQKIHGGQATDVEKLQFRRQIQFHDEYQTGFMGARAETGRALNAFGIPVGIENDPRRLKQLKETVNAMHGRDTEQLAAMLSQMDSLEGVGKLVKDYNRSRILGTVQEVFINSILSGPKTHIVNATGNALFLGMQSVETALAARLGRILPGSEHVMAGEASAMLFGQLTGFRDAARYAAKSFREGRSLDDITKFPEGSPRAISSRNYFPNGVPNESLGAAIDFIGAVIRAPTERVMAPTDEFFKTLAYRGELSRQAYRHAMSQAELAPMSSEDTAKLITEFMENPPAEAAQKAEDFTQYATFQAPLGETGSAWNQALKKTSAGFLIAPFIRTPVNIFKAGLLERSPLALFSRQFRETIRNGGPERDLALARVSLGTLTVGSVAVATASGFITGGGPQNADARKILEASGWQPYSIRLENPDTGEVHYESYARAEPLSFVIGATADATEIISFLDYDDEIKSEAEQTNNAIAAIVAGVANNTMSKTFLSGIANLSEMMSDPKQYAQSYLQSTGAALLPYASFRRQIGQAEDPLIREADSFLDRLRNQSGIPGWSAEAPPRRDVFGDPQPYRGGSLLGVFSPFPDTTTKRDPLMDELVSVMSETRIVPVSMPGRRVDGMKLTAKEYDELVLISRTEPILGGNTFREQLEATMDSAAYQLATPDMRVTLFKAVQERADRIAKVELEKRNADYADRMADFRLRKQRKMFGEEAVP